MVGQTVGYVRVSSAEQNLDRQLEAVGECDRIFEDKISGSSRAKRAGLAELMRYVREGDLVKVGEHDPHVGGVLVERGVDLLGAAEGRRLVDRDHDAARGPRAASWRALRAARMLAFWAGCS